MVNRRLRFEQLESRHAAMLFDHLSDEALYEYIPENPPPSSEALAVRYSRLEKGSDDPNDIWLNWIMLRDDLPIGTLQASLRADRRATIAYLVAHRYWNQGYAKEAVTWMLLQLRDRYAVHVVEAFIDTRNRASIALVTSLGFALRRTIADADRFKGASSDEYVFELPLTR